MRCGFGSILFDDESALDVTAVRGVDRQTKAPQCCCPHTLRSARSRVAFMGTIVGSILKVCYDCQVALSVGMDAGAEEQGGGNEMDNTCQRANRQRDNREKRVCFYRF